MAQYDKLINLGLLNQFLTKAKTIFAPKITDSGILKGDGQGGVSAAEAGTDYATPAQVNAKYTKPAAGIPKTDLASDVQNKLDKTVVVSSTQPTEAENKLWVDTDAGSGNSYQVPTVAEMQAADNSILGNLAMIESSPATQAHAVGEYIVYNGQLYKVTAAIAQGESLTVGGNIQTSVACERDIKENRQIDVSDVFDLHPNVEQIYRISYTRKNNIISLDVMFKTTGNITNGTELFKVNNIDRPRSELFSLLYSASSSSFCGGVGLTYVSGVQNQVRLVASGTVSAGNYIRAYFIYITG